MLLLLLLLLICIPDEVLGLTCISSENSITLEFNKLDDDDFKFDMDMENLQSYDYKDNNIDMCRIEIYVDYRSSEFAISFGDSFPWSQLDHGEARLDFLLTFDQDNSEPVYYSILEYACYNEDQCHKLFLHNHINWLKEVKVNYTLFQRQLRPLLLSSTEQTGKPVFFSFI
jgi:hypothetical protein